MSNPLHMELHPLSQNQASGMIQFRSERYGRFLSYISRHGSRGSPTGVERKEVNSDNPKGVFERLIIFSAATETEVPWQMTCL